MTFEGQFQDGRQSTAGSIAKFITKLCTESCSLSIKLGLQSSEDSIVKNVMNILHG